MKAIQKAIRFLIDFGGKAKGVETKKLHPVLASKLVKSGVAEWVLEETARKTEVKKVIKRKNTNKK